mmetsp:Transcript_18155/g.24526  ORF Transcript_18155/g.24526 Transcript_18155/m.24526 type:complete len:147 (-) Transcript_18155:685-1125(-)
MDQSKRQNLSPIISRKLWEYFEVNKFECDVSDGAVYQIAAHKGIYVLRKHTARLRYFAHQTQQAREAKEREDRNVTRGSRQVITHLCGLASHALETLVLGRLLIPRSNLPPFDVLVDAFPRYVPENSEGEPEEGIEVGEEDGEDLR